MRRRVRPTTVPVARMVRLRTAPRWRNRRGGFWPAKTRRPSNIASSINGTERWVRNTFVPHRDERGVLVDLDGLIQDITMRSSGRGGGRTAREWQTTFDATKDAIWFWTRTTGYCARTRRRRTTLSAVFRDDRQTLLGNRAWHHGADSGMPFVRSRKSVIARQ